ncbi:hypothetical protein F5Y16DRAFT_366300 [Xylariaceae sp. FL0255]|nr:hypothetical protein F5Y16DRAFT_366300 [Xylariaceae sp. FL0255]
MRPASRFATVLSLAQIGMGQWTGTTIEVDSNFVFNITATDGWDTYDFLPSGWGFTMSCNITLDVGAALCDTYPETGEGEIIAVARYISDSLSTGVQISVFFDGGPGTEQAIVPDPATLTVGETFWVVVGHLIGLAGGDKGNMDR